MLGTRAGWLCILRHTVAALLLSVCAGAPSSAQVLPAFGSEVIQTFPFTTGDAAGNPSNPVRLVDGSLAIASGFLCPTDGSGRRCLFILTDRGELIREVPVLPESFGARLVVGADGTFAGTPSPTNQFPPNSVDVAVSSDGQVWDLFPSFEICPFGCHNPPTPSISYPGRVRRRDGQLWVDLWPRVESAAGPCLLGLCPLEQVVDLEIGPDGRPIVSTTYGRVLKVLEDLTVVTLREFARQQLPVPVAGVDGRLYGVTKVGGRNGRGVFYRMLADGSDYQELYEFGPVGSADGGSPDALQRGLDGQLYGTSATGGRSGGAAIFRAGYDGSIAVQFHSDVGVGPFTVGADGVIHMLVGGNLYRIGPNTRASEPFGARDQDVLFYDAASGRFAMYGGTDDELFNAGSGTWASRWTIKPADFNGDGLKDLILYDRVTGLFYKALNRGGHFEFSGYYWATGWDITVIDFDGDGLSDLFLYDPATGTQFRCFTVGNGEGDFAYLPGRWAPGWSISAVDWNTDGRGDLFLYNVKTGEWFRVQTLDDGSFSYPARGVWGPNWNVFAADFNGDGRSDLLLYSRETGANYMVSNVGDSFDYHAGTWAPGWNVTVADLDGDGRSDVFLSMPIQSLWCQVFMDAGGHQYYCDTAPAYMRDVAGFGYLDDGRQELLWYDPSTGRGARARLRSRGVFDLRPGFWPKNTTIIPLWIK